MNLAPQIKMYKKHPELDFLLVQLGQVLNPLYHPTGWWGFQSQLMVLPLTPVQSSQKSQWANSEKAASLSTGPWSSEDWPSPRALGMHKALEVVMASCSNFVRANFTYIKVQLGLDPRSGIAGSKGVWSCDFWELNPKFLQRLYQFALHLAVYQNACLPHPIQHSIIKLWSDQKKVSQYG